MKNIISPSAREEIETVLRDSGNAHHQTEQISDSTKVHQRTTRLIKECKCNKRKGNAALTQWQGTKSLVCCGKTSENKKIQNR